MRLLQEPRRLGPRYLRDFLGLCRRLPVALLAAWCQRPYLGHSQVSATKTPQAMHVNIDGRLGAEAAAALRDATTASINNGLVMVVHLGDVQQVTAAGLGLLMGARRRLLEAGLSLTLAELNVKTRFVLYAWRLERLFDEWQPDVQRHRPRVPRPDRPICVALAAEQDAFRAQSRFRG